MTYRTDTKIRRYVKGYGFMSFDKNIENKYGKTLFPQHLNLIKVNMETC